MVSFTASLTHAKYTFITKRAERENKKVNQILQEIVEHEMTKGDPK